MFPRQLIPLMGADKSQIVGVEWDTASNSPVLRRIDADGSPINVTAAYFNQHPIFGQMWRCCLSDAGVPTFGANARGDGLTLDGSTGQVMVRIPVVYVKSEKVGTKNRFWVSPAQYMGFELHPAFRQRGGTARSQIYVGAYTGCLGIKADGTKYLLSRTGEQPFTGGVIIELPFTSGSSAPVVGETLTGETSTKTGIVIGHYVISGTFAGGNAVGKVYLKQPGVATALFTNGEAVLRTAADIMTTSNTGAVLPFTRQLSETYSNNIGSRWGSVNVWAWDLITRILYPIEYANWNSQSTTVGIGQGIVNKASGAGFAGEVNGSQSADSNIATNGTGKGTGTDGLTPIVYRGIENPWGNVWQFVIGLDALDAAYQVLKRDGTGTPACPLTAGNYESSVAAPPIYHVTNNPDAYVKNLLYEDLAKYLLLPDLRGASNATYLCDYIYWHRSGQVNVLLAGGFWYDGATAGVGVRYLSNVASFSFRSVGARCEFV